MNAEIGGVGLGDFAYLPQEKCGEDVLLVASNDGTLNSNMLVILLLCEHQSLSAHNEVAQSNYIPHATMSGAYRSSSTTCIPHLQQICWPSNASLSGSTHPYGRRSNTPSSNFGIP